MPRQFRWRDGLGRRSGVLFLDGLLQTFASGWCTRGACPALGTRATTIAWTFHGYRALLGCWERCRCYLWIGIHLACFLKQIQIQIQVRHFPLLNTLYMIKFQCMAKPLLCCFLFSGPYRNVLEIFSIMSVSAEKELSRDRHVYQLDGLRQRGSMCCAWDSWYWSFLVISVGSLRFFALNWRCKIYVPHSKFVLIVRIPNGKVHVGCTAHFELSMCTWLIWILLKHEGPSSQKNVDIMSDTSYSTSSHAACVCDDYFQSRSPCVVAERSMTDDPVQALLHKPSELYRIRHARYIVWKGRSTFSFQRTIWVLHVFVLSLSIKFSRIFMFIFIRTYIPP